MSKKWFSAKCIFSWKDRETKKIKGYEERIILLKSISFDEAIKKAESDAEKYNDYISNTIVEYVGFIDVFELFDEKIKDFTEVYSIVRESNLLPNGLLDKYSDDGTQSTTSY